jgi:hypothetical protein
MSEPRTADANVDRRRATRTRASLRASTATVDAIPDGHGGSCYQASEEDVVVNVSRRGVCLVSERPPRIGTRIWMQVHAPGDAQPVEVVGRARWTNVRFSPGVQGGRARCAVGVEVLGGAASALDRFDRIVSSLERESNHAVAGPEPLG